MNKPGCMSKPKYSPYAESNNQPQNIGHATRSNVLEPVQNTIVMATFLSHASLASLSTRRGATKVKYLTEMLVEVLRGATSSLFSGPWPSPCYATGGVLLCVCELSSCFSYTSTFAFYAVLGHGRVWAMSHLGRSLLLYNYGV